MWDFKDRLLSYHVTNELLKEALKRPVPREKISRVLARAEQTQLSALLLQMKLLPFVRTARALYQEPMAVQEAVLKELLHAAEDTEFGKLHGFENIHSVEDFRRSVPLTTWADYEAAARRLADGEADVLFPGKATFFYRTSGTTAAFKFIPESERELAARTALTKLRNAERLAHSSLGDPPGICFL